MGNTNIKQVRAKVVHKHETAAGWELSQYIPDVGEIVFYDPDDSCSYTRQKNGDGKTRVHELPFVAMGGTSETIDDTNQTIKANGVVFGGDDVVEIVGGDGVTITGDAANKRIVIDAEVTGESINDTNQTIKANGVTFGGNDVVEIVGGDNVTVTGNAASKKIIIDAEAVNDPAGDNLGLVQTGGDVTISSGIISVKGNTKTTSETIQKNIIIGPSKTATAPLVNDSTFTNVTLQTNTAKVIGVTVTGATMVSTEEYEWDSYEDYGYFTTDVYSKSHAIPLTKLAPEYYVNGDIQIAIRHIDFEFHADDKVQGYAEYLGIAEEENNAMHYRLPDASDVYVYTTDTDLIIRYGKHYSVQTSNIRFYIWPYYDYTVTNATLNAPTSSVTLLGSGNSIIANFNPILYEDSITAFNEVMAEVQYTASVGGHINAGNKYPYFPNLATNNLMPVSGSVIKPATDAEYNLGSTDKRWHNVYARNFMGTAHKASNDEAGNNIVKTYATKDEVKQASSNTTYTLSKSDSEIILTGSDGSTTSVTDSYLTLGETDTTAAKGNHTHKYAGSSSVGGAATSANKVNKSLTIQLNDGATEGTNKFTFNGSAEKTLNITPSSIGAAASSSLGAVAFSNSYEDLDDTPTVPTKTSQLTNDSGFKTTDTNTTYVISKSGSKLLLTAGGSGGENSEVDLPSFTDTGATSVEVTGSGNVVIDASYDSSTRKITLSKGSTTYVSNVDIEQDGIDGAVINRFLICETAKNDPDKSVSLSNGIVLSLKNGLRLTVKFVHANIADNPTLSVNGHRADIWYNGAKITSTNLNVLSGIVDFIYEAVDENSGHFTVINKYIHPTTAGNKHIPSGGSTGQYLGWSSNGIAAWQAFPTIPTKTSELTNDSGFKTTDTKYILDCAANQESSVFFGIKEQDGTGSTTVEISGGNGIDVSTDESGNIIILGSQYHIATTASAGLIPRLSGKENDFLNGKGAWVTVNNAEEATF